jgi:3-hydroxyacyl-CoA dehydrogenase
MTKYNIHKAVVIGSGTMGAAIAAHLANIGVPVTLLDIVAKDSPDKNKIVKEGWDRCLKARPANLMSGELKTLVTLGNLEDDFGASPKRIGSAKPSSRTSRSSRI